MSDLDYEALSIRAKKYFELYNNSPDMYVSVDPDSAIIKECNLTVATKTGYTKEEIIGQKIFFLYHQDCFSDVQKAFEGFVKNGTVVNAELIIKKKDGTKIPVLLNVQAVKDKTGKIIYSNSCWRDISEIKQLEKKLELVNKSLEEKVKIRTQELENKNKELEQFAYISSHDLQEPLRAISIFSDLLNKEYQNKIDARANKYLKFIYNSAGRMSQLIRGLLEYSRIGNSKEKEWVKLSEILKDIKDDLSTTIISSKTSINIIKLPIILGYKNELRMLFQNLIANAIKFQNHDNNPIIEISYKELNDYWQFKVQDNGIGMKEKYFEKIFIIYQRLNKDEEFEGTGIGLAHCKKIVDLHNGEIWVESELGKGSSFYFTISKH